MIYLNLLEQYRSTRDVLPTHPLPNKTTLNERLLPKLREFNIEMID